MLKKVNKVKFSVMNSLLKTNFCKLKYLQKNDERSFILNQIY